MWQKNASRKQYVKKDKAGVSDVSDQIQNQIRAQLPAVPDLGISNFPCHRPMDPKTIQLGPELPPRLRAQYWDVSSVPEIKQDWTEKVKNHKDKSKYKPNCYVSSSSNASPHPSRSKSTRSSPLSKGILLVILNKKSQCSWLPPWCIGM